MRRSEISKLLIEISNSSMNNFHRLPSHVYIPQEWMKLLFYNFVDLPLNRQNQHGRFTTHHGTINISAFENITKPKIFYTYKR